MSICLLCSSYIIESVSVEALSVTILSVHVVLLTDGGQNVDNYTVSYTHITPIACYIDTMLCILCCLIEYHFSHPFIKTSQQT